MCGIASMLGPCGIYFMARTREATRERKGIEGSFLNDCLCSWFCALCSIIQVARELEGSPMGQSMSRV
uniref:Uncharacterized protein n=2 Tax=Ciona intestinalis TaxID=7719 RepID=F6T0R8_CIOIN